MHRSKCLRMFETTGLINYSLEVRVSIDSCRKSHPRSRAFSAKALWGIVLLTPWQTSHADVYNCSSAQMIEYRDTPCPGGKNLSEDPWISAALKTSGPRTFFV